MGYTVDEGRRLGMGVDMTLGSGWCFGGPTVSDPDANASVVVRTFQLGVGERIDEKLDRKITQALVAFGPESKSIDLTDSIATNGEVFFSPPGNWTGTNAAPKTWTVYAVSQKPSGQKVKRPALGGEGWMLNPAYPQAMRDWLTWFDKAFSQLHRLETACCLPGFLRISHRLVARFFKRNLKNVAATNCKPNCPRSLGTSRMIMQPASNTIIAAPFRTLW